MVRLLEAARRRVDAVRSGDQAGFVMIYVLMITTIVTVVVSGTLVVSTNSIVPSVQASYNQAADAAAQGGLQAFVAYADQNCTNGNSSISNCTLPSNYSDVTSIPIPNAAANYSATYSWVAVKDPSGRYFRVKSTGTVKQGAVSATKVVVGDVVGGASLNVLDYGVVTGFEGQSSSDVLAEWPARTIALDANAANAADYPVKGGAIRWGGTSPGTAAGKAAVCNATFDAKGGRSTNLPSKAPNPYVDVTEDGLAGNNYTHFIPCQTTWGSQTQLLAPDNPANGPGGYYSADALLLSNSYPGGSGPLFNQPVTTNWRYTNADAGTCGTVPGQNYRSFNLLCAGYPLEVGGNPASSSLYPNVQWTKGPDLTTSTPTIPVSACRYAGPTRIVLQGSTAVVTSPQTTASWVAANAAARPAQCYTGAGAQGMSAQTVSLTTPTTISTMTADNNGTVPNTTPAIAHGSSGWPTTGQKLGATASTSNSVFYLTNGTAGSMTSAPSYAVTATPGSYTPSISDNPSSKTDGAWSPQWTSYSATACPTPPAYTDLAFATCYLPSGTTGDAYSWVKTGVQGAIAANPSGYTTSAQLQSLVNSYVTQWNSADASASTPSKATYQSHRWVVTSSTGSAGGCTQASGVTGAATDTPVTSPTSDVFFANTAGNVHAVPSTTTSCVTATVSLQVGTCNVALVGGLCVNVGNYVWGNGSALVGGGLSVPQFAVTFTVKSTTTTSTTTPATSTFPSMSDVTQYQMGNSGTFGASAPGDIYVEGTADHTMALVAADDLVVTGSIKPTDQTTAAIEMVGRQDVRVYHPVKCRITDATMIANTDAGFCPDDITGLYYTTPASAYRPDQQYVNMRPDLSESNGFVIQGAIFALGNSDAHITCPQPPSGGGVCGGGFTVDNYNRGNSLGHLDVVGTLGMAHHSPVGQEWEIDDRSGQTSRPWSGYELAEKYYNMKALIAGSADVNGVLQTTSATSSMWHILSISTGGAS